MTPSGRLIAVAPNGARKTKTDHPALPISPDEIAADAADCLAEGAALLHLHVRDAEGRHSLDAAAYRDAINAVRSRTATDLIIQITTESAGVFQIDRQIAVVEEVKPEACSAAIRELCPSDSMGDVRQYLRFLTDCRNEGVWVQHILYDAADVLRFIRLRADGVFGENTPFLLFVVGRYSGGGSSNASELAGMHDALAAGPGNMPVWAACAFGQGETKLLTEAAMRGGHVRVGFENNLLMANKSLAASNAARVKEVSGALTQLGLQTLSAETIRASFNLPRPTI